MFEFRSEIRPGASSIYQVRRRMSCRYLTLIVTVCHSQRFDTVWGSVLSVVIPAWSIISRQEIVDSSLRVSRNNHLIAGQYHARIGRQGHRCYQDTLSSLQSSLADFDIDVDVDVDVNSLPPSGGFNGELHMAGLDSRQYYELSDA
jgi:hypothetical protein